MSRVGFGVLVAVVCAIGMTGCSPPGGPHRTNGPPPPATATPAPGLGAGSPVAVPGALRDLVTGLAVPWAIAFLPGGDALATERDTARLLRVTPAGTVRTVATVPGVVPDGEGGLLGVAVSPSFPRDRWIFLYYSTASDNRIVRFDYRDGRIGGARPIVTGIPHGRIHNGGRLAFGPDRMLYASTGETGRGRLAQNRFVLAGKVLRMTPEGRPAPGNPFGTLVWSYGHRNVEGLAWDSRGRMYASELGQERFDELNLIEKGRDYGWPDVEGRGGTDRGFTDPIVTWRPDEASPSGLAYAHGSLWVTALRGRRLWQVPLSANGSAGRPTAHFTGRYGRLRAVTAAPDGSLWVGTSNRDGRGAPRPGDDRILVVPLR